jgi:hypothetical protein
MMGTWTGLTKLAPGLVATLAIATPVLAGFPQTPLKKCAADAVVAGTVCLDKWEATVWRVPNAAGANKRLVKKIQKGTATAADLLDKGATQLGTAGDDYAPCADKGENCANDIFAVSLEGETASGFITWFQAQEACANSGKRLPSNAEWQVGANGSPDPGPDDGISDCNTGSPLAVPTGSRSGCVSARGAFDMVGNMGEWVADWMPQSTGCSSWGAFSNDFMCLSGASTTAQGPGALLRGGGGGSNALAGPVAVHGTAPPSASAGGIGFRCAR